MAICEYQNVYPAYDITLRDQANPAAPLYTKGSGDANKSVDATTGEDRYALQMTITR